MGELIKIIFAAVAFVAIVLFIIIAGTLFGGLIAMVVAWVFQDTWTAVVDYLGWDLNPWKTGAMLGFLSGFVKASVTQGKKE